MSPILIASLIVAVGTWLVLRFASKRSEEKKRAGRVAHRQALGLSPEIRSFYYGAVSPKWGETVQNRAKIK